MISRKKEFLINSVIAALFFVVLILHISGSVNLAILTATPVVVLPLLTAFAMFSSVTKCAVAGFICGAFMDSVMTKAVCFNSILLLCLGVGICLTANHLFNKNVMAAVALAAIASSVYFVLVWTVFHAFGVGLQSSMTYLLGYAFPSAVYTVVFVFPFYFIFKHLNRLKTQ